jgi:hypothetical protein
VWSLSLMMLVTMAVVFVTMVVVVWVRQLGA